MLCSRLRASPRPCRRRSPLRPAARWSSAATRRSCRSFTVRNYSTKSQLRSGALLLSLLQVTQLPSRLDVLRWRGRHDGCLPLVHVRILRCVLRVEEVLLRCPGEGARGILVEQSRPAARGRPRQRCVLRHPPAAERRLIRGGGALVLTTSASVKIIASPAAAGTRWTTGWMPLERSLQSSGTGPGVRCEPGMQAKPPSLQKVSSSSNVTDTRPLWNRP